MKKGNYFLLTMFVFGFILNPNKALAQEDISIKKEKVYYASTGRVGLEEFIEKFEKVFEGLDPSFENSWRVSIESGDCEVVLTMTKQVSTHTCLSENFYSYFVHSKADREVKSAGIRHVYGVCKQTLDIDHWYTFSTDDREEIFFKNKDLLTESLDFEGLNIMSALVLVEKQKK